MNAQIPAENAVEHIDGIIAHHKRSKSALLEILQSAHETLGHLNNDTLNYVSKKLNIPISQVFQVATTNGLFSVKPVEQVHCVVCTGSCCMVEGAGDIHKALAAEYGINGSETSTDGRFRLTTAECLDNCVDVPVVNLDGEEILKATPEMILSRVKQLLEA